MTFINHSTPRILCTATLIIFLTGCTANRPPTANQPVTTSGSANSENVGVASNIQQFKTNQTCIDYIKDAESVRLEAYVGPAGHMLIGYGHNGDVEADMVITMREAENLLKEDLQYAENAVKRLVEVNINQNQFSALVCLAYNIGTGNLAKSTLLRELNQGNYREAANQFLVWRKANGVVNSHLEARRAKEKALFEM